jgi:hypothetical protein
MEDLLARFWTDLVGRLTGPMNFRIVLQPTMAMLFATLDGIKDAKEGRPPYLWNILKDPQERQRLVQEGWKRVLRIAVLAVGMDAIYQLKLFRWIYPGELVVVVLLLAFVPYLLLRGPINRVVRSWLHGSSVTPR